MTAKPCKEKISEAYREAVSARWVFLLIAAYTVFANFFLGSVCLLKSTTGLPCPGCGGTRAFLALVKGDLVSSLKYNPLLIPAALIFVLYAVAWLTNQRTPRYAEQMVKWLGAALIVIYAIRMVLLFPREQPMVINYRAVLPRVVEFARSLMAI